MVLKGDVCDRKILNGKLDRMREFMDAQDGEGIRNAIKEILPEYKEQEIENT